MSKITLAVTLALLIVFPAVAAAQHYTLWREKVDPPTTCDYFFSGTGVHFVTIWFQPAPEGVYGVEYTFMPPMLGSALEWDEEEEEWILTPYFIMTSLEKNPATVGLEYVDAYVGPPGYAMTIGDEAGDLYCMTQFNWFYRYRMNTSESYRAMAPPGGPAGQYTLEPYVPSGRNAYVDCLMNYPDAYIVQTFGYNAHCEEIVATYESSWGAIKNLMR